MQKTQETWVWSLGREDALEEGVATHSNILAWRIPWREGPGKLQSRGSQWTRTHASGEIVCLWKRNLSSLESDSQRAAHVGASITDAPAPRGGAAVSLLEPGSRAAQPSTRRWLCQPHLRICEIHTTWDATSGQLRIITSPLKRCQCTCHLENRSAGEAAKGFGPFRGHEVPLTSHSVWCHLKADDFPFRGPEYDTSLALKGLNHTWSRFVPGIKTEKKELIFLVLYSFQRQTESKKIKGRDMNVYMNRKWISWGVDEQRINHWGRNKKQRHHFADKGLYSQSYGFSSSHVQMWELDHKEGWAPKNRCFWTVVLEKTHESPFDRKEIEPVNPKGNQAWIFTGRTDAEAEAPIFWHLMAKNRVIGKDPDAGKDWRQEEKGTTEDEMVGWHHQLEGHEFEQTLGVGDRQRNLACCSR